MTPNPNVRIALLAGVFALTACSDAAQQDTSLNPDVECPEGYTVGADGSCDIPSIGASDGGLFLCAPVPESCAGEVCNPVDIQYCETLGDAQCDADPRCRLAACVPIPSQCPNGVCTATEERVCEGLGVSDCSASQVCRVAGIDELEPSVVVEDDGLPGYFLNQEGDGKITIFTGESARVAIRVITPAGAPAEGRSISFEPKGETKGAAFSAQRAFSNGFGIAEITVTAGMEPTWFQIEMASEDTAGLTYNVNVVQRPFDPQDPGSMGPIGIPGQCLQTEGTYSIRNRYEPARFLGDGVFNVLDQIREALQNPGRFAADRIAGNIGGIGGSIIRGAIEPVVNFVVDYVIGNYAPDWLRWILTLTEDVTAILTELEINGKMILGPVNEECEFTGVHRWETLVFLWRAGCEGNQDPNCGRHEIPLEQFGVSASESEFSGKVVRSIGPVGEIEIYDHTMRVNLGVAVIWFVTNVILPGRFQGVRDFGDLLGLVIPCDVLGQQVASYVSIPFVGGAVGGIVREACEEGLDAAGDYLMGLLADALGLDAFPLAGECRLRDTNGDRAGDEIQEGRWNGDFAGDFTGQRIQ
jgi:hypothetical protein